MSVFGYGASQAAPSRSIARAATHRDPLYPPAVSVEREITTMNVSLPRTQKEFVDKQVQQGSFSTLSDYIRDLIRREQRAVAREELERKLLEGLHSGRAKEMTKADWKELRDGLLHRRSGRD